MTQLGGREVYAVVTAAGFQGEEIKRAQCIAFAATRWQDHYVSEVAGVPDLTQWGLFATNPNDADPANPRGLFDPYQSAADAHRLWIDAGGVWDWHPVVKAYDGALVRGAWTALDEHNLWMTKTPQVTSLGVPFGHPNGVLPPGVYPRG